MGFQVISFIQDPRVRTIVHVCIHAETMQYGMVVQGRKACQGILSMICLLNYCQNVSVSCGDQRTIFCTYS